MVESVKPEEPLAHYILEKSYYRSSDNTVKPHAFMLPAGKDEISVFRTISLSETEIWQIGITYVSEKRGKPLLGRAELIAKDVTSLGLDVKPDPVPHPRHANITGFPHGDSEKTRMFAVELAARATLHLVK